MLSYDESPYHPFKLDQRDGLKTSFDGVSTIYKGKYDGWLQTKLKLTNLVVY